MANVTNSIRLNDYMSSTLRTINTTMERTITIMQRLDRGLYTLDATSVDGLRVFETSLSAVMDRVQQLAEMIQSIGTGAGPDGRWLAPMNAQLSEARQHVAALEAQLSQLGGGQNVFQSGASESAGADVQWAFDLAKESDRLQKVQTMLKSLGQVNAIAAAFQQASAQLNLINDGLHTQSELQQQVLDIANQSGASYIDMAAAISKLGQSPTFAGHNDDAIRFADLTSKALAASGSGPQEAANVLGLLAQAMKDGALSTEAFNAAVQNGDQLLLALSAGLGSSAEGLRQMAMTGDLTADTVARAILQEGEAIEAAFAAMPHTFDQNVEIMKNTIGVWVADMAQVDGAIGRINQLFTSFVTWIAQNSGVFDLISTALFVVAHTMELIAGGIGMVMQVINALGPVFDAIVNTVIILLLLEAAIAVKMFVADLIAIIPWFTLLGQAAAMLQSPIFWIAAAIGILLAMLNNLGFTANDIITFISGLFGGFLAFVLNIGVYLINSFLMISQFLGMVFIDPVYAVQLLFYNMVDNIIGFINELIGSITKGLQWIVDKVHDVTGLKVGNVGEWVLDHPLNKPTREGGELPEYPRLDYIDAADIAGKIAGFTTGFLPGGQSPSLPSAGGFETIPNIDTVGSVSRIGRIDDDVNIAEEDLKYLVSLATQKYVNNINLNVQTSAPQITNHNMVREEADLDRIVAGVANVLGEQREVTVEQEF